jgi:hypothetical protein
VITYFGIFLEEVVGGIGVLCFEKVEGSWVNCTVDGICRSHPEEAE